MDDLPEATPRAVKQGELCEVELSSSGLVGNSCFGESRLTALTAQDSILLKVSLAPLRSSDWDPLYFKALNTSLTAASQHSSSLVVATGNLKQDGTKNFPRLEKASSHCCLLKNPPK